MRTLLTLAGLILISFFSSAQTDTNAYIMVLGVAQDGGYPHVGCAKQCCQTAWSNPAMQRYVTSLALVDPVAGKWWLIEATPDITRQLHYFQEQTGGRFSYLPWGIFVTHAHIGHYTGLMQLGKEAMNTSRMPVYVLPEMKKYLQSNGPWSQLVKIQNITLVDQLQIHPDSNFHLQDTVVYNISDRFSVAAFTVPHRDEFSETAGFLITTRTKKYMFIPDIDKWQKWSVDIRKLVGSVDIALLDGTFFANGELPGRNMAVVPHPFVSETMHLFTDLPSTPVPPSLRARIHFIHFNHTNPLLWDDEARDQVRQKNFNIAQQGQKL